MRRASFSAAILPLAVFSLFVAGCEEIDYIYVSEPPPAVYGCWEAFNPEDVGLDEIRLGLYSDGSYHYYSRIGYHELEEEGEWDFSGYREICFTSDYINGRHEHSSWDARFWVLDDDELKFKFSDSECECPVYLERSCH